jgi:putative endonuclease
VAQSGLERRVRDAKVGGSNPLTPTILFYNYSVMITVYVIKNISTQRKYVGITNNLGRRLREHKRKESKGSSGLGGEFEIVLREEYPDNKSARVREKFLKSGIGREWLKLNQ